MYCEHCHPNIQPSDFYTIDSSQLCEQCQEEFYQFRYGLLVNPIYPGVGRFNFIYSVWMDQIETVFPGIDDQTKESILLTLNPVYKTKFNVNETPIRILEYIIFESSNEQYRKKIITDIYSKVKGISIRNYIYERFLINYVDVALQAASHACEYTRNVLKRGSGNYFRLPENDQRISDRSLPEKYFGEGVVVGNRINDEIEIYKEGITDQMEIGRRIARRGILSGIGNCEEHTAVAFFFLYDNYINERPIDYVNINKEHAFVIIGAGVIGGSYFRKGMIICDPFCYDVYECDSKDKLREGQKFKENLLSIRLRVDENNHCVDLPITPQKTIFQELRDKILQKQKD